MNELATIESGPLTKVQVVAQKNLVQEVMKAVMKDGTHYGVIPGCKQPTLYKAGSEAMLSTFRIAVVPQVEDLSTYDCYRYRVNCQGILPSGEIVGVGVGECSTDEEKYKWRATICLAEYEATPEDRRRFKFLKEPTSWNKEGLIRQVRTNPADLSNTALKMAKKRAQIDLTLTALGVSDIFTQDLEDLSKEVRDELMKEEGGEGQTGAGKPAVTQPTTKAATTTTTVPQGDGKPASEAQIKMLGIKLKNKGISAESFCAHFKIKELKGLSMSQVNPAMKIIDTGEIAEVAKTAKVETVETHETTGTVALNCCECDQPLDGELCRNPECVGYNSEGL